MDRTPKRNVSLPLNEYRGTDTLHFGVYCLHYYILILCPPNLFVLSFVKDNGQPQVLPTLQRTEDKSVGPVDQRRVQ